MFGYVLIFPMIGTARFSLFERNWKKKKRSNEQVQGVFFAEEETGSFRERLNVVRAVDNRPPQRDLDVVLRVASFFP